MKFISKNLYFTLLFAVCYLLFANIALAHQVVETRPAFAETAKGGLSSFHYLAQYQLETALPNVPRVLPAEQMLPTYLNYLFIFGLGIIGIVALGVMTAGGIQYILAAGNVTKTDDAKDMIKQALIGLGFLLVSYLLLYTINPDLVNLRDPQINLLQLRTEQLGMPTGGFQSLQQADEYMQKQIGKGNLKASQETIESLMKIPGAEIYEAGGVKVIKTTDTITTCYAGVCATKPK